MYIEVSCWWDPFFTTSKRTGISFITCGLSSTFLIFGLTFGPLGALFQSAGLDGLEDLAPQGSQSELSLQCSVSY